MMSMGVRKAKVFINILLFLEKNYEK